MPEESKKADAPVKERAALDEGDIALLKNYVRACPPN